MRSGRWPTQGAINVLALGAWAGVTGIVVFMDGVRPPIVIAYLVIILSTVLFSFLVRAYRNRLNELHAVGRDLARRKSDLKASQAELHRAQAVAKVGSWVFDIAADTIRYSAETCRIFDWTEGSTGNHGTYLARVHPEDQDAVDQAWQAAFKGETLDHEHRIVVGEAIRWIRCKAELKFAPDGAALSAIGIAQDITARKEVQAALQDSEERYRTMIEWSPESILVHRLGKILYVNSAAIKLFGAKDAQGLLGKSTTELIHPDCLEAQMVRMKNINDHVLIKPMVESRFLKLDGAAIDVEVQGTAIVYDGKPAIHVCIRDITERKQMEKQVHQLAFYDTLTELPNRRLLNDRLGQSIAASKRSGRYGALIFLDLDNFKSLNDTHGHGVGDLLLVDAANRLQNSVREQDTVARFGGDEFVVMLCELDSDRARATAQAAVIAEIIRAVLTEPYRLCLRQDGKADAFIEHLCTVSIGVALFVNHEASQDDILKWADTAMYQSKKAGGNLVLFHDAAA
ncbi:MAG: diguanylate cyclase [Rhodoferax sp.]